MAGDDSGTKTFHLELEAELLQVASVLKAVLHSILFHRLLHLTGPKEASALGITHCAVDDVRVESDVDKGVRLLCNSIGAHGGPRPSTSENVVVLSLFEKRDRRGAAWLPDAARTQRTPWECWSIKINVHLAENDQQQRQFRVLAEKQLRACLFYIASVTTSSLHHVPSLDDPNAVYVYKIATLGGQNDSWTSLFRRMLHDTNMPSLLK